LSEQGSEINGNVEFVSFFSAELTTWFASGFSLYTQAGVRHKAKSAPVAFLIVWQVPEGLENCFREPKLLQDFPGYDTK
jgi:hypothetical protein